MADSVSGSMSSIRLLRRGRVLDSGELLISDLQREDSGNYTCSVTNPYGADAITYSLIVQGMYCGGSLRREPHRERGDNLLPRCALIRGMHETSNAEWWDATVTWQLTPLSQWGSLSLREDCLNLKAVSFSVPPSAPVLFVGLATSSSVLLHWKTADTGGAPITGYTLTYRRFNMDSNRIQIPRYDTSHDLKVSESAVSFLSGLCLILT